MPCEYPILLRPHAVDQPALIGNCKSSDPAFCEYDADLHQGDIRTSLLEALDSADEATFFTLTAPGANMFGRVHSQRKRAGKIQRCSCGSYHKEDDPQIGVPINPDTYRYDLVAAWNATSRRIITSGIQKLRRLLGYKIEWAGVPELNKRGTLHWHCVALGDIPAELIRIAFHGGINPRTGYDIKPAHHEGQTFGDQLDVQRLTNKRNVAWYITKYLTKNNRSDRGALSPQQQDHLHRLSNAVLTYHGACECRIVYDYTIWAIDYSTGEITETTHSKTVRRIHATIPHEIQERISPWLNDRCHRRRRALRQAGHIGRSLGRSRNFGPSLAQLRQRRCQHNSEQESQGTTEEVQVPTLRYGGRGYHGHTLTSILRDHAGISEPTKIIHFSHCALPNQEGGYAAPAPPPATGLRLDGSGPPLPPTLF
ncbi:MAG: replication initiator [Candidatus Nanopelagicales bacterium]